MLKLGKGKSVAKKCRLLKLGKGKSVAAAPVWKDVCNLFMVF